MRGRISRVAYWRYLGVGALIAIGVGLLFQSISDAITCAAIIGYVASAGRMRDCGWAPWWRIIIVPVLIFVGGFLAAVGAQAINGAPLIYVAWGAAPAGFFTLLGVLRGDPESNRYGPPQGGEVILVDSLFS